MVDPVFVDTSEGKTLVADSLSKNKQVIDTPVTPNVESVVNQNKIEKNKDEPMSDKDEEKCLTSKDKNDTDDNQIPTSKVEMRGRKCGLQILCLFKLFCCL